MKEEVVIKKNTDFLIFSIITFLTVASWTGFEVYRAISKGPTPKVTAEQIESLNPDLNEEYLQRIESRIYLAEEELQSTVAVIPQPTATLPQPTATPTDTPIATDSSEIR